jgi:hypothetical protein
MFGQFDFQAIAATILDALGQLGAMLGEGQYPFG